MNEDETPIISVKDVSKNFRLPHEKTTSVKSIIINSWRQRKSYELQEALKGISFEVKRGEFYGIVGRNGSGKSTLLKLLAGIYIPSKGSVQVNGSLTPFIELGVGFNPELTGRENVFLNGALLGFSRKEMLTMYDDIVEFAEIERFMDQKLKNYSSGMQVRLAFSIAIRAESDILLVDEVLAVGDERFQNKCLQVFENIRESGRTIVFISHDMETIKRFCDRVMVIHNSHKIFEGDPDAAATEYIKKNFPETIQTQNESDKVHVKIGSKSKPGQSVFQHGDEGIVKISWKADPRIKNVGVAILSESGQYIFGTNTIVDKVTISENSIEYHAKLNLISGRYYIQVGMFGDHDSDKVHYLDRAAEFSVVSSAGWQGLTQLEHKWVK